MNCLCAVPNGLLGGLLLVGVPILVSGQTEAQSTSFKAAMSQPGQSDARIKDLKTKLARALAKRARFRAEIVEKSSIAVPRVLVTLVGRRKARSLIKTESRLMRRRLRLKVERRLDLLQRNQMADDEIETLSKRERRTAQRRGLAGGELRDGRNRNQPAYIKLSDKPDGLVVGSRLHSLSLQNVASKTDTGLAQAFARKDKIRRDLSKLHYREANSLFHELEILDDQITALGEELTMAENMITAGR